jgi:hypothetical protein
MELGTAAVDEGSGELARGYWEVTDLPTGTPERLPVVLLAGAREGPTAWLVAGVHGDELTGPAAVQDVAAALAPEALSGSVVCLPSLNPAGLRRSSRASYYHDEDPNRQFPDPEGESTRPPRVQERIARRVYEAFAGDRPGVPGADLLVDLHTAQVGSVPFLIRDRVLYGRRRTESEAAALSAALDRLTGALDLPAVVEYGADEYVDRGLHRSVAGAALNAAGVPAATLELGSHSVVEERPRAAGVAAVCRALREWGLLETVPPSVASEDPGPEAPLSGQLRRHAGPRTATAGLVRHRVEAGDTVRAGETVADVVAPTGERRDTVETDYEGYVLARSEGLAAYEGDPVASLAVRDDGALVAPREEKRSV